MGGRLSYLQNGEHLSLKHPIGRDGDVTLKFKKPGDMGIAITAMWNEIKLVDAADEQTAFDLAVRCLLSNGGSISAPEPQLRAFEDMFGL